MSFEKHDPMALLNSMKPSSQVPLLQAQEVLQGWIGLILLAKSNSGSPYFGKPQPLFLLLNLYDYRFITLRSQVLKPLESH